MFHMKQSQVLINVHAELQSCEIEVWTWCIGLHSRIMGRVGRHRHVPGVLELYIGVKMQWCNCLWHIVIV